MQFSEGEQIMADPVVRYEAHEKVSVITLNRPEKLNAISAELQGQLLAAFTRAVSQDPSWTAARLGLAVFLSQTRGYGFFTSNSTSCRAFASSATGIG